MFDELLSFLFPEQCRGCNIRGTVLCRQCQQTLIPASSIPEPAHCFALYNYRHPLIQKAVWELKYYRKSLLAKKLVVLGQTIIVDGLAEIMQSNNRMSIVLVPIPQHYTKTYKRGFNQSQLIAKWVKAALPTATLQPLLRKTHATDAQSHTHNRQQRQKNLAYSMTATGSLSSEPLYILIDDVITTGSTITEAGRALRAAGARNICAIALAHGYKH